MWKNQAEGKGVPLGVMHQQQQQQHDEDRPVERPLVTLSKWNVIVAINLIPKLNEEQSKFGSIVCDLNKAVSGGSKLILTLALPTC